MSWIKLQIFFFFFLNYLQLIYNGFLIPWLSGSLKAKVGLPTYLAPLQKPGKRL